MKVYLFNVGVINVGYNVPSTEQHWIRDEAFPLSPGVGHAASARPQT
jgi:hypothetical protein